MPPLIKEHLVSNQNMIDIFSLFCLSQKSVLYFDTDLFLKIEIGIFKLS